MYLADRPFSLARVKRGATGAHVCGSETDFTTGAVFDPLAPANQYDEQGLPLCCGVPAVMEMGGQTALTLPDLPPAVGWSPSCMTLTVFFTLNTWINLGVRNPGSGGPNQYAIRNPTTLPPDGFYTIESAAPLPPGTFVQLLNNNCVSGVITCVQLNPGQTCASGFWFDNGNTDLMRARAINVSGVDTLITIRIRPGVC